MTSYTRILYVVNNGERRFERFLKEKSFNEMKRMVCSKLGLDSTAPMKLFQRRAYIEIDLDDEDDFEVFKVVASKEDSVCVKVVISPPEDTQVSGNPTVSPSHEST